MVAVDQVGVAEIELVVHLLGIGVRGPGQVIHRRARVGAGAAPQLHDPKVVQDRSEMRRRRRGGFQNLRIEQPRERRSGGRIVLGFEQREPGAELRARGEGRGRRDRLDRGQRGGMIALLVPDVPEREPRLIEPGELGDRGLEKCRLVAALSASSPLM